MQMLSKLTLDAVKFASKRTFPIPCRQILRKFIPAFGNVVTHHLSLISLISYEASIGQKWQCEPNLHSIGRLFQDRTSQGKFIQLHTGNSFG
jgi:hypothetical protein